MNRFRMGQGALLIALATAVVVFPAAPAFGANEVATKTTFSSSKPITVPFGADWLLEVSVEPDLDTDFALPAVGTEDGTVAFRVSGQPESFADDASVFPGGVSYFTQPDDQDPLAPGEYTITAIFNPTAGGDFATSKTRSSATLVITPLSITPRFEVINDPSISAVPMVRTSIGGDFVSETGAPPAGQWAVSVIDPSGQEVFQTEAEQPTASDSGQVGPFDIPIPGKLKANSTFEVLAVFTPESSLEPGLVFTNPQPASFSTAPPTLAERLAMPIPAWVLAIAGAAILAAIVMVIVLAVKLRRKKGPKTPRSKKTSAAAESEAAASATTADVPESLPVEPVVEEFGEKELADSVGPKQSWEIKDIFADETAPNEVPTDSRW